MFNKYEYYKHVEGRDAVIRIMDVRSTAVGYELAVTWHVTSYHGGVYPAAGPIMSIFVSQEDSEFWYLYEAKEEQ